MPETETTLVWLREDLRLDDHPALAALEGAPALIVYVHDDATPGLRPLGGASKWWLDRSLRALAEGLGARGGRLDLVAGPSEESILRLARAAAATRVLWTRRYGAAEMTLDARIKAALKAEGVEARSFNGRLLREPWEVRSARGEPISVFTPFWRAHQALGPAGAPLPAPERFRPIAWPSGAPTSVALNDLKLAPTKPDWSGGLAAAWTPGEAGAQARLAAFLERGADGYADGRNRLDEDHASRLSPHLRFGEVSPHRILSSLEAAVAAGGVSARDAEAFAREIGWREFSYAQLVATPDLATKPRRAAFDAFPFRDDGEGLRAWRKGRTGYPVVDAGMRELWATGTMHNRARMVVASFLVKHLLIDWPRGEQWFWDTLCDADPANNPASWQWVAGCGADAAPFFRIFNPVLQGEKFDPKGDYVRRWVPEIARLPAACIHAPWSAPEATLADAGVKLGATYPAPVVDHDRARQRALAAFASIRAP